MAWFSYTALVDATIPVAADFNTIFTTIRDGTVTVAHGGTGLASGTAGGLPYFSATTTIASTGTGAANSIMVHNGTTPSFSGSPTIGAEDSRTNSVVRNVTLQATTTGTPAAGIGTGLLFNAESGDEAPSNFGALDFAATDVTAGSEDTYLSVLLRVAGAAITACYRFAATAANKAIFTHANTADRTYTLPDVSGGVLVSTTTTEFIQRGGSGNITTSGTTTFDRNGNISPTFAVAFSGAPRVFAGNSSGDPVFAGTDSVTTTGFRMTALRNTESTLSVAYLALGV